MSSRLRSCESPELARLSLQITDLKRKISNGQVRHVDSTNKLALKPPTQTLKSPAHDLRSGKGKLKGVKQSEDLRAQNIEAQLLLRLQKFQCDFEQNVNRIHLFVKRLIHQMKELEQVLFGRLREMKDSITLSIDPDINNFLRAVKKYEKSKDQESLTLILDTKEKISLMLHYNTSQIDKCLIRVEASISKHSKQFQTSIGQHEPESSMSRSNVGTCLSNSTVKECFQQASYAGVKQRLHSPKESSNRKYMLHLQQQRRQYTTTKDLLKL